MSVYLSRPLTSRAPCTWEMAQVKLHYIVNINNMFGAGQIFVQHSIYSDFYCTIKIYREDSHEYSEDCLARKRQAVGPYMKLL